MTQTWDEVNFGLFCLQPNDWITHMKRVHRQLPLWKRQYQQIIEQIQTISNYYVHVARFTRKTWPIYYNSPKSTLTSSSHPTALRGSGKGRCASGTISNCQVYCWLVQTRATFYKYIPIVSSSSPSSNLACTGIAITHWIERSNIWFAEQTLDIASINDVHYPGRGDTHAWSKQPHARLQIRYYIHCPFKATMVSQEWSSSLQHWQIACPTSQVCQLSSSDLLQRLGCHRRKPALYHSEYRRFGSIYPVQLVWM